MWTYCHVHCLRDSFTIRKVGVLIDPNNNVLHTNYCEYCGKNDICDECNLKLFKILKENPSLIESSVACPLHLQ